MTPAVEEGRKRGLGRGLSALLGEDDGGYLVAGDDDSRSQKTVPIEFLRPNPNQPRKRFDDDAIEQLVASVEQQGILQPLLVRRHPELANAYEIVAGERRWRAAQRAKLHEVPVVIRELSDTDTLEIGIIENIHREDLTPLEEAEGYQKLIDEFGHTQDAVAKAVGKSRSHIANMLRLLGLSEEVKSMLDDGRLSAGHARALLGLPAAEGLAHEVVKKGLSVRETERLAQQSKPDRAKTEAGLNKLRSQISPKESGAAKDPNAAALEHSLADALGMKVSIEFRSGSEAGRLIVGFSDFDQLDLLSERLGTAPRPAAVTTEM